MGQPSFGYMHVEGQLVEAPDEQEVIHMMEALRAEGASYANIAAKLNSDKILNRGRYWNAMSIINILRREGKDS